MSVSDGTQIVVFKDLGLVSQVFDEQVLSSLRGHVAVGHCRYSTTGSTTWENAQPTFRTTAIGSGLSLGHNGNLVNTAELLERARDAGIVTRNGATTDSDLLCGLLAAAAADPARSPAAGARPAVPGLGGGERDRRAGHRRRLVRARGRARRAAGDRRRRAALGPVRQPRAEGLHLRVRLPGPAGHHDQRALGAR